MIAERNTMICKIFVSQKYKIPPKNPSSPMAFINGGVIFKKLALSRNSYLECNNTRIVEAKHEHGVAVKKSLPPHQDKSYTKYLKTKPLQNHSGMEKIGDKERASLKKRMDKFYCTKRNTNFKDHIELEKLNLIQTCMKKKQHLGNSSKP